MENRPTRSHFFYTPEALDRQVVAIEDKHSQSRLAERRQAGGGLLRLTQGRYPRPCGAAASAPGY